MENIVFLYVFSWIIYHLLNCNVLLFQGTIASIFNDSSTLGRRYVFDIRRTCREVHDNARRAAHRAGHEPRARRDSGTERKVSNETSIMCIITNIL